jgi:hypothetical protein
MNNSIKKSGFLNNDNYLRRLLSWYNGHITLYEKINLNSVLSDDKLFEFFRIFLTQADTWIQTHPKSSESVINLYLKRPYNFDVNICNCKITQQIKGEPNSIEISTKYKNFVRILKKNAENKFYPNEWRLEKFIEKKPNIVAVFTKIL